MRRFFCTGLVIALWFAVAEGTAHSAPVRHCGTITGSQSWTPSSNPHTVCAAGATVVGGIVTITPGAIIMMEEGANLVFGSGGGVAALGDANGGKIRVTAAQGEEPGYWGQWRFEAEAAESQLNGIDFRYGGKDNVPMVEIRGGPVVFDPNYDVVQDPPVEFHRALGLPLAISAEFIGPALELPGRLTVGAQCGRVVISGNGRDAIGVLADRPADVLTTQTWFNFCVPYAVDDPVDVGSPDGPRLQIGRGAVVEMEDDAGFRAGVDAERPGYLDFMGTAEQPVTITGREKTPGAWGSIEFTEYSGESEDGELNSLMDAVVEYGGRGGAPMVQVRTTNILAFESQFGHALAQPLALIPAAVGPFMSALVRSGTPSFVDNGIERIMVLAAETPVDIPTNTVWGDPGAAYQIDGEFLVAGEVEPAVLTLQAGAELLFDAGAALVIGDAERGRGGLRVQGFITDSVRLSGAAGTPGSWLGLRITNHAEAVSIDAATIEYGGTAEQPMVDWGRVPGRLVRTTLRGAPGYPLAVPLSYVEVVMDEEHRQEYRNSLVENGTNRILVRVDGARGQAHLDWSDPGAPLEFDGDVVVGSPTRPLLVMNDGLTLLFRANSHLQIGASAMDRAAVQVRNDVPSRPVMIGAARDVEGWGGVRILRDSTFGGSEMVFSGAAADGANVTVEGGFLDIDRVQFRGSRRGIGLLVTGQGSRADISDGLFTEYRIGIQTANRGRLDVSRSSIRGNLEWGIQNQDPALCQRAIRVYWGAPGGPQDDSDAADGCMNAKNNSPGADRVSDDVEWWPYAIDEAVYAPVSGIGPNPKRVFLPSLTRS